MRFNPLFMALGALALAACEKPATEAASQSAAPAQEQKEQPAAAATKPAAPVNTLSTILDAQNEEVKARYPYRRPADTLKFFGIEPGMTVVEVLPGGGWYTKILLPYIGEQGTLVGVNYPNEIWPKFGFFSEEQIEERKSWGTDWPKEVAGWGIANSAAVKATNFGSIPSDMAASADAVLFVRALHNLARFNEDGFLDNALADTFKLLKPGGIVGIVQHQAREAMPDDWAQGPNGYIKKSFVIEKMQAAGFKLLAESDLNENPKDVPGESDRVWRLPPTLGGSKDKPELREAMQAIGESHRMTLKFQKPE